MLYYIENKIKYQKTSYCGIFMLNYICCGKNEMLNIKMDI